MNRWMPSPRPLPTVLGAQLNTPPSAQPAPAAPTSGPASARAAPAVPATRRLKAIDAERSALLLLWVGLIALFGWWPQLDLWVAGWFYDPAHGFAARQWTWLTRLDAAVPWVGRALFVAALSMAAVQWWRGRRQPRARRSRLWRQSAMLLLTLTLGLGGVVHEVLKNHWGRPRPDAVMAFGGTDRFMPALQPSQQCRSNCSFVSGHAATGFALMAVGMLGGAARRRRWLWVGAAAGLAIGGVRMALGRHFLSDILFCLAVMWSCALLLRWLWLLRCPRPTAVASGVLQ